MADSYCIRAGLGVMDKLPSRKLKIPAYSHFCWVSRGGPQKPFTKGYLHLGKCTESHGIWQATGASARLPAREAGFHRLFLEARETLTSREEGTVRVPRRGAQRRR